MLKLKSILRAGDQDREEVERELFDIKQFLCYRLSEGLLARQLVEFGQLGERGGERHMAAVRERAARLADELRLKREVLEEAERGEIFREYFTRIAPLSFGSDAVRYLAKNAEVAAKVHLQAVLLEAVDQCLIDRPQLRDFEQQLWREDASVAAPVQEQWLKWKAVNKEALLEDYRDEPALK